MLVSLRPELPEDEPFLRDLLVARLADELCAWAWDEKMREPLLNIQYKAQQQGIRAMYPDAERSLIQADGRACGRLVVAHLAQEIHLVDIAIAGELRGAGIGSKVIAGLLAEADGVDKPVRLHVNAGNRALRLYQRFGFARIGGSEVQISMERIPKAH